MQQETRAALLVNDKALQTILEDVQRRNTIEACGVLLGKMDKQGNWLAEQAHPLQNSANSAVYFEFAPEELLNVEITQTLPIIGVYHSHPTGYPAASPTDRANMKRVNLEQHIPWAWLIICGPFETETPYTPENPPAMVAYHHYSEGLQQLTIKGRRPLTSEQKHTLLTSYIDTLLNKSVQMPPEEGVSYRCPCCGYRTLEERGGFDICPVCFWEDDGQDEEDANTNRAFGPNGISLAQARENYRKIGAVKESYVKSVRPPLPEEQ